MFLTEDYYDDFVYDDKAIVCEAFNQIVLTEGFEEAFNYLEAVSDFFAFGKSKAGKEIEEIRQEVEEINDQLEDNKISPSKMKSKWNFIVGKAFKFLGYMLAGGTLAAKDDDDDEMFQLSAVMTVISFFAGKFITQSGDKKDLNVIRKDINKMLEKIQEIKKKSKNKKRLEEIEIKLRAVLDRIEKVSMKHDLELED